MTIVDILHLAGIELAAVAAEMSRDGLGHVPTGTVQSWSRGKRFPNANSLPRLAAALERIGGRVADYGAAVRTATRAEPLDVSVPAALTRAASRAARVA